MSLHAAKKMVQNKAFIYKKLPTELPVIGEHYATEQRIIDLDAHLEDGSILVETRYLSLDPYMRARLLSPGADLGLGKPMTCRAIFKILKSANSKFKVGQTALCMCEMANYAVISGALLVNARVLDNPYNLDIANYLGPLGAPGLTAYASFYDIGQPKRGETIFISAAAGAVGQIVVQLAKHAGLITIGSVGDDKKLEFLRKDLNCDKSFNYKKEKPADALRRLAPEGIDIYYDNVGGATLDAVLPAFKQYGRIIACGAISEYNVKPEDRHAFRNLTPYLYTKRLTIRGFSVTDPDIGPKYAREHEEIVGKCLADGTFKAKLEIFEGIDQAGEAFLSLFTGGNNGKVIVRTG